MMAYPLLNLLVQDKLCNRIFSCLHINMYLSVILSALFVAPILATAILPPPPYPASVQGADPYCWELADKEGPLNSGKTTIVLLHRPED